MNVELRRSNHGTPAIFKPWVRYDHVSDTLLLYFYGEPEPAVNVDVEGTSLYLMMAPETDELVGVHIQAFAKRFLPDHPQFRQMEAVHDLISNPGSELTTLGPNDEFPRSLAEMVVGNLVFEHGLMAS